MGIRSAIHSFFIKATKEEEQEHIFLGMQAAVTKRRCNEPAVPLCSNCKLNQCATILYTQRSLGDKEPVAIDSRVAAQKRAAQAAAQKEYEQAVGAQHTLLLKEEGNSMRQALQEKVAVFHSDLLQSLLGFCKAWSAPVLALRMHDGPTPCRRRSTSGWWRTAVRRLGATPTFPAQRLAA